MTVQVTPVVHDKSEDQMLLQMAGSALGGFFGGPVGAVAGGKVGGELAGSSEPAPQLSQPQRRMQQIDQQQQLIRARDMAQNNPNPQVQALASPLDEAIKRSQMRTGVA